MNDGGTAGPDESTDRPTNDGNRFDRLPATEAERAVEGRPTRAAVLDWWEERYGLGDALATHTFWEKGAGKIWAYAGTAPDPCRVETLGLHVLRARQRFWKPTTDAVQRFARPGRGGGEGGIRATRNVAHLDAPAARRFVAGEDLAYERDGDPGYLIVAHELAGRAEPIGVGLWTDGELRSVVPKSRRVDL